MKQRLFFLLATILLMSTSVFAQSTENWNGDVNKDGVVDVADINAIIYLMKKEDGDYDGRIFYWYVGQTDPSTMNSISPIVSDNSSPGWREIGTTLPNYSSSNMLWNGDNNNITFENRDYYYVAVPSSSIKIYNAANGSVMDSFTNISTKTIAGVTYYIYPCNTKARAFAYNIF